MLAALLAAAAAGYCGHRWLIKRRGETDPESHDHLLTAILGLLALLLGFTFSLALNRYETRRELVVQEANALGTTWLRVQLLEPPNKAVLSGLLRQYRAAVGGANGDAGAEIVGRDRPGRAHRSEPATFPRPDGRDE
jgi:hypothetical protein